MEREKVFIGYPHGGKVDGAFCKCLLDLQRFEDRHPNPKYELLDIDHAYSIYISENRNSLAQEARAKGADWLFQLDPDETFEPTLLRIAMRTADKETRPVIVGIYANIGNVDDNGSMTLVDCLYKEEQDGTYINVVPSSETEMMTVDAAGTGIFLTHLSVFEKLSYPWFFQSYIKPSGNPLLQFMNEDIGFCRTLREAGFQIWVDPLAQAIHWKTLPISPSSLRKILTKAQAFRDQIEKEKLKEEHSEIS